MWAVSALLLLAILYSGSRLGMFDAFFSLLTVGVLVAGSRLLPEPRWRWASVGGFGAGLALLLVLFPPSRLVQGFAAMASSDKVSSEARLFVWKESLSLIGEFRWFGCGLGGFESTFLKYQNIASFYRVEFAHSDYLQFLAELGLAGFSILLAVSIGILIPLVRGILKLADEDRRLLLIGCVGGGVAVALHSLGDFNLYIPANAMALAWIAGIGALNGMD